MAPSTITNADELLREAQALEQAGRLDEAEARYRRLLEQVPSCGEVHFLLACVIVRSGRPVDALPPLVEAARLLPEVAEPRIVLGNALISLRRWSEAIEALTSALALRPDIVPATANLALALYACGRKDEAEAVYRRLLERDPGNLEAHRALAHGLNEQRRYEEAEPHARMMAELAPRDAAAQSNLGDTLVGLERLEESEAAYLRAIAIEPGAPGLYLNLAAAHGAGKRFVEAEQAARCAQKLDPDGHAALHAIGQALIDLDRFDDAIDHVESALRTHPRSCALVERLADAHSRRGLLEDAVALGLRAVELDPSPGARHALGEHQIRTGRFLEGWRNMSAGESWAAAWMRRSAAPPPKWDGAPLDGGALLVHSVGGLGDTIQFARYLPLLLERTGGRVVFQCQPAAIELLRGMPGFENVIPHAVEYTLRSAAYEAPPISVAAYVSVLGIPTLFDTTEESIPSGLLPIRVREEAAVAWRERLSGVEGLKVGLCWAGSPAYKDDRYRSTRLDEFAPLAGLPGVSMISLQLGPPAGEIGSGRHGLDVLHLPEELSPIVKTAALIRELDVVISVDTAVAHLAGALGVETWLLLPFVSHWIWNAYRANDTPWYPNHRLFRQPRLNDWPALIERVAGELAARAQGQANALSGFGPAITTEELSRSQ